MQKIINVLRYLICLIVTACASVNSLPPPADNPDEGTAQQGAPAVFEHRN